ncbi:MAG: Replicative DNA helicase [Candidatus Moranbacteria bacterium GW2011_GWE2_35_2-]|nr:MAG: Replicative DNA helicase [Candidatus Moranbacteria bacterium GW2011_GWE2_35_2-]KKQ22770.1 MAG: Replicative DNA helicase [Candidatus Moranbacteria bacterium GW2011_GWF2_37_11]KKQ30999.1 MAG: Replicative DNA helicase [Candidatus Moranbacteria bacterium GW2011_GWE1_37_24]KKQ48060.1 MAG: Replicative DNA helicase [Candidatus Moranbacteria bacterium GW2011_GWD2_37_9]HBO16803.1 replicative DNA helicase [Candidatus Moranbacteria bacterium]
MANKQSQNNLRVPPNNLEAEQSVLGSLMLDKDAIIKVADFLNIGDFYKDTHNIIYQSMLSLYESKEPIDVLSLSNKLEENKELEITGGSSYLASLVNSVPSSANVVHYAKVVQKKAILRRLINVSNEITEIGYQESEDVEKTLDQAEQKLFSVSQKYTKKDFVPIKSILESAFNRIDELHKGEHDFRGIPTGFSDLDNILSGLQKSDLIILAARPSIGKTTLALDIARQIGTKSKIPVGIFSLEMSSDQLIDRMIAAEADVDLWRLRTGRLRSDAGNDDFQRIGSAMGSLSEAPIYIDDAGSANIMEIRTMARRLQSEHKVGLIIIDYLQLMEGRKTQGDSRVQEISEISRALKQLAREINVPVLALSQLSRAVESRSPQIPKLSDLRESGSIEQDADVVLFLYREDREKPDTPNKNIVEVIVSKHRNGPLGKAQLYFKEESTTFKNLEKIHNNPQ